MIRYAILYFVMLIIFVALIVGPIVASKFLTSMPSIPMQLLQPTGLNHNDTSDTQTGTGAVGGAAGTAAATSAAATAKLMIF